MPPAENESAVRTYALKLLARREYSAWELRNKVSKRFPDLDSAMVDRLIEDLRSRKYLDDARYAEQLVSTSRDRGRPWLEAKLRRAGVDSELSRRTLDAVPWPTLAEAIDIQTARMNLHAPLARKDAVRLARALARLGYDIEEIQLELEHRI